MTSISLIADHRIERELGRGGMGVVYLADYKGQRRALKVLLSDDLETRARFLREAQAVAAVDEHPNIARVFSVGEDAGRPYISFEFIEGQSLDELLKQRMENGAGPFSLERAVEILVALTDALEHVHRYGILHRDLKPANILIRESDGQPLIADFGLAVIDGQERLTRTGELLGTPAYMAPEQIEGEKAQQGPWTDVWALTVIFHDLLTGQSLFAKHSTLAAVAMAIVSHKAETWEPSTAVPRRSLRLLREGLQVNVSKRIQDMPGYRRALLQSLSDNEPVKPPSRRLKLGVGVLLLGIVAGALGFWQLSLKQAYENYAGAYGGALKERQEQIIEEFLCRAMDGESACVNIDAAQLRWQQQSAALNAGQRARFQGQLFESRSAPRELTLATLVVKQQGDRLPGFVQPDFEKYRVFFQWLRDKDYRRAAQRCPKLFEKHQRALQNLSEAQELTLKGDFQSALYSLGAFESEFAFAKRVFRDWRLSLRTQLFMTTLHSPSAVVQNLNRQLAAESGSDRERLLASINEQLEGYFASFAEQPKQPKKQLQLYRRVKALRALSPKLTAAIPAEQGWLTLIKQSMGDKGEGRYQSISLTLTLMELKGSSRIPRPMSLEYFAGWALGWLRTKPDAQGEKRLVELAYKLVDHNISLCMTESELKQLSNLGLFRRQARGKRQLWAQKYWRLRLKPDGVKNVFDDDFQELVRAPDCPRLYKSMAISEYCRTTRFDGPLNAASRGILKKQEQYLKECLEWGHPDPYKAYERLIDMHFEGSGLWSIKQLESLLGEAEQSYLEHERMCQRHDFYKPRQKLYWRPLGKRSLDGRRVQFKLWRGFLAQKQGALKVAMKLFRRALELDANCKAALKYCVLEELRLGRAKQAQAILDLAGPKIERALIAGLQMKINKKRQEQSQQ